MVLMYYMLLQKGKKKGAVTVGVGTSAVVWGGASRKAKVVMVPIGSTSATRTGAAAEGDASRKAKIVVVPTVEKAMTRIAAKKQKKQ